LAGLDDVAHPQPDEIAGAQFAVDGEVEQRQVADAALNLQVDPDSPDLVTLQRWLLARDLTSIPSRMLRVIREKILHGSSPFRREEELLWS
jgi:hypothetical protein